MTDFSPGGGGVTATLTRLRSECETCGEWSAFTGRTEVRNGRTYVVVRCPNGDGDFTVWRRDREALVAAYEGARQSLRDPDSYDRAIATVTGRDASAVAALLAAPPAQLPLFAIEDLPDLPAEVASQWCRLLLDWDGWRPMPTRAQRIEEALATALACRQPACVAHVAAQATPDELRAAVQKLERRFPTPDPSVLIPLLQAMERGPSDRGREVRSLAERLCRVATGSEAEIRTALALLPGPPPLGASDLRVTPGPLSLAEVDLRFASPTLTRADLDGALGGAQELPLSGPGSASVLWYGVGVPGAPARVSVFARFFEPPAPGTPARTIQLRIDPAPR